MAAGDLEEASKHYHHLLSLEPRANSFEQAMIAWSGAAIAEDLAAQAQHLEVALVFSPRNHILLHNLAWVRYQMGDCEAALRSLAPAVESRWSYPPAYMILGRCLLREGRFEETARRLEESLAFTTPHLGVLAMLEALALLDGDREKARRYRARLAEREGSLIPDTVYLELGEVYAIVADACVERGNLECAHQALARAVALEPGVASHHDRWGDLHLRSRSLRQAAAEYHKALEVDPSWTHAHLMLGRIAEQQGAHEEAATHFHRWLELVPAHPERERVEMRLKAVKPNG